MVVDTVVNGEPVPHKVIQEEVPTELNGSIFVDKFVPADPVEPSAEPDVPLPEPVAETPTVVKKVINTVNGPVEVLEAVPAPLATEEDVKDAAPKDPIIEADDPVEV